MVNVAVLVSGGGTNLQALIDARDAGQLPAANLRLVVADRSGCFAIQRAEAAGIEALTLDRTSPTFARDLLAALDSADIAAVVLAGFLTVLPPEVVAAFEGRMINVHPSLIPAFSGPGWYGLKVHEAALERGVRITGATVHRVTEEADGGPILAQKAVGVEPGDTPETLQRRVMEEAEWVLLPRATQDLATSLAGQPASAPKGHR